MVAVTDPFAPPDGSTAPPPPWGPPPPPWGQPQPWYGGWQPVRRRTNPLAIAALVTGILALVPIAVGLGIAAVVQVGGQVEALHAATVSPTAQVAAVLRRPTPQT